MNFIETIYNQILKMRKKVFSVSDVAKATGLEYGFDKRTLVKTLDGLVRDGKLAKAKNGKKKCQKKPKQRYRSSRNKKRK